MRYRIVFMTGVAVGFLLGARAGRERYEQIMRLARRAADNPSVQQAAAAAQAQAAGFAQTARERVPGLAGVSRSRSGGSRHQRAPGSGPGSPAGPSPDGQPYVGTPGQPQP